jgi:hypothetical protein
VTGARAVGLLHRLMVRVVQPRPWLCFAVMCTSFGLFGAGTLNIFSMFSNNWDMITEQGVMALATGSIGHLLELIGWLLLSMVFYTLFKVCEHSLVHEILHPSDDTANHEDRHPPR